MYESLMLNLLYGSYDIKQVASEPITTKVFRNELPFETIPALEPEEAILWFFEKKIVSSKDFELFDLTARSQSFAIAGEQDLLVIEAVKNKIQSALENGIVFEAWKKEVGSVLGDRIGLTFQNPYHMETVFRTNMNTAYNAGRFVGMQEVNEGRPFWTYHAIIDSATRDDHAEMDGFTAPFDDPVWDTWYPPNGFSCRCTITSHSVFETERDNIKISTNGTTLKPDTGFEVNSARAFLRRN